jgi:integrase
VILEVRVEPQAEDVAEGVHHRRDLESLAEFPRRLKRGRSQGEQTIEGCRHVVDLSVGDGGRRSGTDTVGRELAVGESELLGAGVHPKAVSERLGHSSVAFTMDTYSAVIPSMGRAAADAADTLFG